MIAYLNNVQISSVAERVSQKTGNKYIVVYFITDSGEAANLLDRNLQDLDWYKSHIGQAVDFKLVLSLGRYTSVQIFSVDEHKEEKV